MAYDLGTVHELGASGVIAVDNPLGLSILLSNIPATFGVRLSQPIDYYNLGRVSWGNDDGFMPSMRLEHVRSLFLDIPDGITLVGITLTAPVTCTVTELWGIGVSGSLGLVGPGRLQLGSVDRVA